MKMWWLFLPVAGLVILSGFLGFRIGQSTQMSETATVNFWAAQYVNSAGSGAKVTDCAARPYPSDLVWLVITCASIENGTNHYPIGYDGRLLPADDVILDGPEA